MRNEAPVPEDRLTAATATLRDVPVPPMPQALVGRSLRFARQRQFFTRPLVRIAAVVAILVSVAFGLLLHPAERLAFADVVQSVRQTKSFTCKVTLQMTVPDQPTDVSLDFDASVKGGAFRAESLLMTMVGNQESRQVMVLFPTLKLAHVQAMDPAEKVLDLYGLLHDYKTGTEKALGQKTIGSIKAEGFELIRDAMGGAPDTWQFWVDPATRLPLEISLTGGGMPGTITVSAIRFDVALEDGIFSMTPPAGYMAAMDDTNPDPWNRRLFSGQVLDERGMPVAGVRIVTTARLYSEAPGALDELAPEAITDRDGKFRIDAGNATKKGGRIYFNLTGMHKDELEGTQNNVVRLEFRHPDYIYDRLEDVMLIPPEERGSLKVRLHAGKDLAGKVVDGDGKPVAGAIVEAVYGRPQRWRTGDDDIREEYAKRAISGADGSFALKGLPPEYTLIQARRTDSASAPLWGQATVNLETLGQIPARTITMRSLALPASKTVHDLLGMKLIAVDDEIRNLMSLPAFARIVVVDPGPNSDRLGLGKLQQGDIFWMTNDQGIADYTDLLHRLADGCQAQQKAGKERFSVHVLTDGERPKGEPLLGGYLKLTPEDLAEIQAQLK